MTKTFDKNTFGDSPAAVVLADMLSQDEYRKYSRTVTRIFTNFARGIKLISNIESEEVKNLIAPVWFQHYKEKLAKSDVHADLKSYTRNIMVKLYKETMNKPNLHNIYEE
jgi:hypothetical protein